MKQEMQNRDFFKNKVYGLQFISAVLVVMIHTYGTTDMTNAPLAYRIESFVSFDLASVAVPLFFCLSGFLFYQNFRMDKLLSKWKSRVYSVLIPYFIWNLIYYVYFYLITRLGITNEQAVPLDFKTVLSALFCFRYNEVFWFMFQLIVFIALAPAVYCLVRNKWIGIGFLAALGVVYAFGLDNCLTATFVRFPLSDSLFFYASGAWLGLHGKEYIQQEMGKAAVGAAALVASQMMYGWLPAIPVFSLAVKALLVVALYYLSNCLTWKTFPNLLICSFPIYTVHEMILEVLNKAFSFVIPDNSNWILLDYVFSPALTIVVIVFVSYGIKKKLPGVYRVLWGKR